jgi:hypothetical protein
LIRSGSGYIRFVKGNENRHMLNNIPIPADSISSSPWLQGGVYIGSAGTTAAGFTGYK